MVPEEHSARCAQHTDVEAKDTCSRCGRFVCASCSREEVEGCLCAECLARPEVRLGASPRAKRAVWLALVGLHGLVILLPVALWVARAELAAINAGEAPVAGRPWAQGATILAAVAAVAWLTIGMIVMR